MRKDKQDAINLRKNGKSYAEICELLSIPKATLSDWFKNESWSKEISTLLSEKSKNMSTVRLMKLNLEKKGHLTNLYEQARVEATEEFKILKNDPLFISGMMLYWGEGDKVSLHQVRISNSDPEMIKIVLHFLHRICGTASERIWLSLLLYPDNKADYIEKFWRGFLKVEKDRFQKSVFLKGKEKTRRLEYGICTVGISSRYLKEKMLVWLKLLKDELISRF